jgi:hypothetical protein
VTGIPLSSQWGGSHGTGSTWSQSIQCFDGNGQIIPFDEIEKVECMKEYNPLYLDGIGFVLADSKPGEEQWMNH